MRVAQRQIHEHTAIIRALADKTIEVRQPALINLPIALPSVPVLTPLLSPIISGNNGNGNGNGNGKGNNGNGNGNGGNTATATTTAASSTSTSSGDTGGSTSGSSSGSTGSGSSSGSSAGDSGSTGSSGDGSSSSGGSSGNSSPSGSASSAATGTTSTNGSQPSNASGGSVLTSSGSNNGTDGTGSSGHGGGGASASSGSGGTTIVGGVANAGQTPSAGSGTTGSVSSSMGASGITGSTDPGTGTGGSVSGGGALSSGSAGGKHGLSGGATAAIIICLLALIFGCVIFFIRRRSKSRRNERVNRWWFARNRTSQTYGDRNSQEIMPTGMQTARSSFATTVDHTYSVHSNPPCSRTSQFIIPPLPPMAQIGRANGAAPTMVIDTSYFNSGNPNGDNRFSIGSANSDSQYLIVNHRDSLNPELGTPMSVRPFSPSESFAFPKPPDPASSRPSSSATLAMQSPAKTPSSTIMPIPSTPPALRTLIVNNNPINNVTDPFQDNNPFDDPVAAVAVSPPNNGPVAGFAEIEFICRPFHPTLPDELSVRPQDPVRVLQTFDDGWALVEKVRLDDPKGKGKRRESSSVQDKGLIPLDCLRAPGQELPDFFAAKRVSSYAGSVTGSTTGIGFQVL